MHGFDLPAITFSFQFLDAGISDPDASTRKNAGARMFMPSKNGILFFDKVGSLNPFIKQQT